MIAKLRRSSRVWNALSGTSTRRCGSSKQKGSRLEGSDAEDTIQAALSQHQVQITELLQTKLSKMPEEIRPLLVRLRVSLRAMGEKLADVNADFEALIVALSQDG